MAECEGGIKRLITHSVKLSFFNIMESAISLSGHRLKILKYFSVPKILLP